MSYIFRRVKCPWCEHVFMWKKPGAEGTFIYEYRIKSTGEYVKQAKCPGCGSYMLVSDSSFVGLDIDDERVETLGIRGI